MGISSKKIIAELKQLGQELCATAKAMVRPVVAAAVGAGSLGLLNMTLPSYLECLNPSGNPHNMIDLNFFGFVLDRLHAGDLDCTNILQFKLREAGFALGALAGGAVALSDLQNLSRRASLNLLGMKIGGILKRTDITASDKSDRIADLVGRMAEKFAHRYPGSKSIASELRRCLDQRLDKLDGVGFYEIGGQIVDRHQVLASPALRTAMTSMPRLSCA